MYRGSSFLLRRTFTAHEEVVERLASPDFAPLWHDETGTSVSNPALVKLILSAVAAVKEAYVPFGKATDTLATKVLLGTVACLPACDRFFKDGFKARGYSYSKVNRQFVERMLAFCSDCRDTLRTEQTRIQDGSGLHYPLMKLADMYFWEIGYEMDARKPRRDPDLSPDD
jgi:hypothetical protein